MQAVVEPCLYRGCCFSNLAPGTVWYSTVPTYSTEYRPHGKPSAAPRRVTNALMVIFDSRRAQPKILQSRQGHWHAEFKQHVEFRLLILLATIVGDRGAGEAWAVYNINLTGQVSKKRTHRIDYTDWPYTQRLTTTLARLIASSRRVYCLLSSNMASIRVQSGKRQRSNTPVPFREQAKSALQAPG